MNLEDIAARPESHARAAEAAPLMVHKPLRALPARSAARGKAGQEARATAAHAATTPASPPPYGGFQALPDNYTAIPPDTTGAVGPQHIVTMLNTQALIQTRTGAVQSGYPISLEAFWSALGTFPDIFDPRIQYDAASDRWIASVAINGEKSSSALLVAVSQTGDPGGKWNQFKIDIGSSGGWADYPVLGFNGKWVVVSVNLFSLRRSGNYLRTTLYVFNKADLYNNGSGAYTTFSDPDGELIPALDYDNHPDTLYFVQTFAGDVGVNDGMGTVRISKLQGPVGQESFSPGNVGDITISDAWSDSAPNGDDFAPQAGTSTKIDTGDSRLQNCAMRGGSIWCAHTVFLPLSTPTRAAAQWMQIDPAARQVVQRGRKEDPTGATFYAYPSIAVNRNNDVLMGYTRFSENGYASAGFTWRKASDPPNTTQGDTIFKPGESTYVSIGARSGSNRWGDYSVTWVDPADDLTFWTLQEYAATPPGVQTGKFGTWWAETLAPSAGAACTYSVTPASQAFSNTGTGNLSVATGSGCPWMAASNVPWITINSGTPGSGNGSVTYFVAQNPAGSSFAAGTITVAGQTFTVTQGSASQQPAFPAQGVVNAASYQGGGVAPGELVTVFGTNLGPASIQFPTIGASGAVSTTAGGTRVLFDGAPAPMIYALGGQVSAVVPFAVQGKQSTQVQVEYLGAPSNPISVGVTATAPAVFSLDSTGRGQGAVLNEDNSVNGAAHPAARNSVLQIYATGGGAMTGAVEGTLAQPPLAQLANATTVSIGGLNAEVKYAGAAPGIVTGVLQINAVVPPGVQSGAVPLSVTSEKNANASLFMKTASSMPPA
ncbi:MAG: hypothetical protein LAQ30_10830, partial [Acidobacteriia bacterium]|nr:hypothetical protein [Terriglobia bacterium]